MLREYNGSNLLPQNLKGQSLGATSIWRSRANQQVLCSLKDPLYLPVSFHDYMSNIKT